MDIMLREATVAQAALGHIVQPRADTEPIEMQITQVATAALALAAMLIFSAVLAQDTIITEVRNVQALEVIVIGAAQNDQAITITIPVMAEQVLQEPAAQEQTKATTIVTVNPAL